MKYIVVTGGVLSGLGKWISVSSIGRLLISRGLKVTAIKIDPYLNSDAGTMNPFQHGEVFVQDDGGEVDLDLGNYERFLDISTSRANNITTGKVYKSVIEKERRGDYLGKTVQIIPHITNEIKHEIKKVSYHSGADVCLIEVGGTVGDIESMPFLEAARQLGVEVGKKDLMFIHTTLVPVLSVVGEQKTKPTQHSVKELRAIGIMPDMILCRAKEPIHKDVREKLSLFCDVPTEGIISAHDVKSIYQVPLVFEEQGVTDFVMKRLELKGGSKDLSEWRAMVEKIVNPKNEVEIAIVGKYIDLKDSYISHIEAFNHVGSETCCKVNLRWIEAESLETCGPSVDMLNGVDGVLIPGGFGVRGSEGKMKAINYARVNKIPFLGVCFGFQLAVAEFSRNVLGKEKANSTELDPATPHPVICILPEQKDVVDLGGTMRLGAHSVKLVKDCMTTKLYGTTSISERHRHRFEVNPDYISEIEKAGMRFVGKAKDMRRMEVLELKGHPYFVGSQFHPEFKSRPGNPSRLHLGLVRAAIDYNKGKKRKKSRK